MKPILFNTDMVHAILDGRKTVTRRVVKPKPVWDSCDMRWSWKNVGWWRDGWNPVETITWKNTPYRPCDILYVRETFQENYDGSYSYRAGHKFEKGSGWCPSIHMPREAARIFLRVMDVRVERLQDITEDQAKKEAAEPAFEYSTPEGPVIVFGEDGYYNLGFKALWDSTIKPTDRAIYGWDANPWVWVIEFERISKEEAGSWRK